MTAMLVLLLAFGVTDRTVLALKLQEAEARATSRADLLDAVNGAIVDGLCVSDSWGHVLLANAAAGELGGADGHGVHVHDATDAEFYWPDGSQVRPDELPHARALRGEAVPMSEVIRRDPVTGHEKVLAVSAVPLHFGAPSAGDAAEAGPLAVVLMRDVTQQRAQQRALENFVAVVAHDLKGPLAGVISWAEIAKDQLGAEPAPQVLAAEKSVDRIHATAGRMNHLITDLLDYTVAESAELQVRRIDLDELVDAIARDLERPGEAAVVEHTTLGDVMADALLTRQLFSNLITNALKFVAPGVRPHIFIESTMREDVREIRVSDNGVGIPDRDRARVFDTFYRSSEAGRFPGSGLGLAICLRAVERHGGWIAAQEGPGGRGTTLVFTLPLSRAGFPTPATVATTGLAATPSHGQDGRQPEDPARARI
jgi:signal transduction histidine kinase